VEDGNLAIVVFVARLGVGGAAVTCEFSELLEVTESCILDAAELKFLTGTHGRMSCSPNATCVELNPMNL
jgi:hypothetical protein